MLKSLIYLFDDTPDNNFDDKKLNELIFYIREEFQEYYNFLDSKGLVTKAHNDKHLEIHLPNNTELISDFFNLLNEIDGTNSSMLDCIVPEEGACKVLSGDDWKELDKILDKTQVVFKELYDTFLLYGLYVVKFEKLELHTDHSFTNEFFQFLTHYSYATIAFEMSAIDQQKYDDYIETNYMRGLRHLERAVLDAYKVLVTIVLKNVGKCISLPSKLSREQYAVIIEARQYEVDSISNNIDVKIKKYKKFLAMFEKLPTL
jgi:hypothetical protein